jgi:uncharacterized OsmC-like protein
MNTQRREQLAVEAAHSHAGITVSARTHRLTVDEAAKYGGQDAGANPVEYLLSGLAAASIVVLRILGEGDVAETARLEVSATLNVDRVMGESEDVVFDNIQLRWEVASEEHADRLRRALPDLEARRPGQALIDAAAFQLEEVVIRDPSRHVRTVCTLRCRPPCARPQS